jgi:4-amino-4-deoxy-L-arabinose transferase-like glycosyltransferase
MSNSFVTGHSREKGPYVLKGLLWVALAFLICSIIILSLVPPVSKDELVHHLAIPKLYLKHGGMYEIPFMPFSYYPANLDLLYLVPLYFGNDIVPKHIHFFFALATAWLIFRYLKKRTHAAYALAGVLLFLSIPVVVKLSVTAYIDLGIIFFSTASLLWLLKWLESGFKKKFLVISGIFCGLGLGTKYNGLITLFLLTLFAAFLYARHHGGETRTLGVIKPACQGLVFFLVSLAIFSPWMIRNYSWTRNPVYPLYDQWFNPPSRGTESPASEVSDGNGKTVGHSIFVYRRVIHGEKGWEMALLPLRIFFEGKDGDPQYFDGRLNPLLLLLPLLAFYRSREDFLIIRQEKRILTAFALLFFAFAFFSTDLRMRYIAPIIPPLVILSVFGLRNLLTRIVALQNQYIRHGGMAFVVVALISFAGMNAHYLLLQFAYIDPFSYLRGKLDRHEYIARFRPEYEAVQHINKHLPKDATVSMVFLGDRGYYLEREYVYGEDLISRFVKKANRAEDILTAFKARGITHLFINDNIFLKWLNLNFGKEEKERLIEFVRTCTTGVFSRNGFSVLSLTDAMP